MTDAKGQPKYISLHKEVIEYELVIQFEDGGAMIEINENDDSTLVANKLRELATRIEGSVVARARAERVLAMAGKTAPFSVEVGDRGKGRVPRRKAISEVFPETLVGSFIPIYGQEKFMSKEQEILDFLHENVFDPILESPNASASLKQGVRLTIMRLEQRDAAGMIHYYWSAIVGTERSTEFARQMRHEGFTRFEEVIDEFRDRFNDRWLRS